MTRRIQLALGLDLLSILLFAIVGRLSHQESVLGAPLTALPFLIGAGLGWYVVRSRSGLDADTVGPGLTVWVFTVVIGLVLRAVTGGGIAASFMVVTLVILGILMIGWRAAAERWLPAGFGAETPAASEDQDVDA
ncbi:DUF3054 domain-containing protein [Demetria terragena]|uniref:DUF3054 domain-containing protein n=1 Tax=Demetria terragena TaxID=63959 RepID=UPI000364E04A|nr:DUF3054 domain-containing protein [Demetria terragena]